VGVLEGGAVRVARNGSRAEPILPLGLKPRAEQRPDFGGVVIARERKSDEIAKDNWVTFEWST
jgi:hypothetical protein